MWVASVFLDFHLHITTTKEKKVIGGPAIFLTPAEYLSIFFCLTCLRLFSELVKEFLNIAKKKFILNVNYERSNLYYKCMLPLFIFYNQSPDNRKLVTAQQNTVWRQILLRGIWDVLVAQCPERDVPLHHSQ